jgi:hypothetical protein
VVTNSTYKSYSNQIAKLFCKDAQNKILCEATIAERLNSFLDDYTYPFFLAKLGSGRSYATNLEAFQNKGFRVVIIDLITGERETAWWTVIWNMPYYGKLPGVLLSHQYNIISANKTFSADNREDIRITWNPIKPSYGITFIPDTVGQGGNGGNGGGGGGPRVPPAGGGGGTIGLTPPTQTGGSQTQQATGFDFKSLLENPMVLIGAGLLAVYFLMKK